MKTVPVIPNFFDHSPAEVKKLLTGWGEDPYRADQLLEGIYAKRAASFQDISSLSKDLRERLGRELMLYSLTIRGKERSRLDGTVRYDLAAGDGTRIAAVFLPAKDRSSVCVSTQAGCSMACTFCRTGAMKFKRNLTRGEILQQILIVERDTGQKINGVLLMGMGEPLLNYDNVVSALHAMVDHRQLGLGRRHVTLSSVGIVPKIRKLADEGLGIRLALSLHAVDGALRRKILPKVPYDAEDIMTAGLYYSRKNRSRLTVEYLLASGLNDTLPAMQKLVSLLRRTARPRDEVQVNLIPCNPGPSHALAPSSEKHIDRFKRYLEKNGILATVRQAKGADIGAACGQLGV